MAPDPEDPPRPLADVIRRAQEARAWAQAECARAEQAQTDAAEILAHVQACRARATKKEPDPGEAGGP